MIRFYLYIFLLMITHLKLYSQTDAALIVPTDPNGTVHLNIFAFKNAEVENFRYEYLSVFVKEKGERYSPIAIQGRHTVEGEYLVFLPYFPFEKGMTYIVKAKYADNDLGHSFQSFQVGKKQTVDKAKVVSIYPSGNQLPENLLRFYIYFNTPMKKGQAVKHIQLVDAEGTIDNQAFMEFKQELWSPDGKRLTLLFDPGRIKRGVSTNMELGPALLEGKQYNLVISGAWEDLHGQKLEFETTKEFTVAKAYRQYLDVKELVIHKPEVNSHDTLSIHFDRIIDHALIHSMIQIENEKNIIFGHWKTSEQEKTIQFIPEKTWEKGTYRIIMDSSLEDAAGNNLDNLLDQKAGEKHNQNIQQLSRRFTI